MLKETRNEVEDLLSSKIKYHHQFQGRENGNIARLVDLLQSHPVLALETFTEERFTPLEFMITRRLSLGVIREFCARHPKALRKESSSSITEGLPLHVACDLIISIQTYTCDLIPLLIDLYPEAASIKDKEGNLPLHKLLRKYAVRLRPQLVEALADCMVTEVQALLKIFPEGIMTIGSCITDMTPLDFVLSIHSNILHPRLLYGMLDLAPASLTELRFEGSLGGSGVLTQQCAQSFERLMPQLTTIEWALASSAQYSPAGWSCFIRNIGLCENLRHLDIHVPTRILADDNDGYAATIETLSKLLTLSTLDLSFNANRVNDAGRERISKLAEPIATLIQQGNLQKLAVNTCHLDISIDPIRILAASINSKLQALELRPCPGNLDLTTLLVDLLQAEGSVLRSLALKNIRFQTGPFFHALAQNSTLRQLRIPNIINDEVVEKEPNQRLSNILKESNTTLQWVQCVSATLAQRKSTENKAIQYYTLLNRFGRAKLRQMSCTRSVLAQQLANIVNNSDLQRKENGVLDVCYGILREVPMLWSS